MKSLKLWGGLAAVVSAVVSAPASAFTLYTDLTSWTAATTIDTVETEDFQGYAAGVGIFDRRLDKLPNVKLTTNLELLNVVNDPTRVNKMAFASDRLPDGSSVMIATFNTPVTAMSFELIGLDGNAPLPPFLFLQFADGERAKIDIERLTGEEFEPYFIGVVAAEHGGLRRVAFQEGSTRAGLCCNAVGWDNLATAVAAVPEPSTYALMLGGLLAVGWLGVRRSRHL